MYFAVQADFKITLFELHHSKKLRTDLTNIIEDNKKFFSLDETKCLIDSKTDPQSFLMVWKRKIPCRVAQKSPNKKPVKPVGEEFKYPYTVFEKKIQ